MMIIFSAHQKSEPGRRSVVNDSNLRKNFVEHITQYSCSSKVLLHFSLIKLVAVPIICYVHM